MSGTRRKFDAALKARVALEAVRDAPAACTCAPAGSRFELAGARVRVPPRSDPVLLVHVLRALKALG